MLALHSTHACINHFVVRSEKDALLPQGQLGLCSLPLVKRLHGWRRILALRRCALRPVHLQQRTVALEQPCSAVKNSHCLLMCRCGHALPRHPPAAPHVDFEHLSSHAVTKRSSRLIGTSAGTEPTPICAQSTISMFGPAQQSEISTLTQSSRAESVLAPCPTPTVAVEADGTVITPSGGGRIAASETSSKDAGFTRMTMTNDDDDNWLNRCNLCKLQNLCGRKAAGRVMTPAGASRSAASGSPSKDAACTGMLRIWSSQFSFQVCHVLCAPSQWRLSGR